MVTVIRTPAPGRTEVAAWRRLLVQRWLELVGGGRARGGALLAVGGAWSAPGQGPFPQGGLIPVLKPLYNDNWVVGFAVALVLYWGLTMVSAGRQPAGRASDAGQQG
jgi:cytosine/uracil/thiamine/allantoin permease